MINKIGQEDQRNLMVKDAGNEPPAVQDSSSNTSIAITDIAHKIFSSPILTVAAFIVGSGSLLKGTWGMCQGGRTSTQTKVQFLVGTILLTYAITNSLIQIRF